MEMKNKITVLFTLSCLLCAGCGVKGDPEPPLTPPELGHGQPAYRRTTRELAFPNVPPVESSKADSKKKASPGTEE
jgi:hypothetical protein